MSTVGLPAAPLGARVARNFFTHSGHVPLVVLILGIAGAANFYARRPVPVAGCRLGQAG